jgi:hypothetical protein
MLFGRVLPTQKKLKKKNVFYGYLETREVMMKGIVSSHDYILDLLQDIKEDYSANTGVASSLRTFVVLRAYADVDIKNKLCQITEFKYLKTYSKVDLGSDSIILLEESSPFYVH